MVDKKRNEKIITLVDKYTAFEGFKFIFRSNDVCSVCNYYNICNKLEEGRVYEVVGIIKTKNKIFCKATNEYMQPVEVKLSSIVTSIRGGIPFDTDVIVHWHSIDCGYKECKFRNICFPTGLKDGDKIKIKEIIGRVHCPLNYNLLEINAELV